MKKQIERFRGLRQHHLNLIEHAIDGLPMIEIARKLGISESTVHVYKSHAVKHTGAANFRQLCVWYDRIMQQTIGRKHARQR